MNRTTNITADQLLMREINKTLVLDAIRTHAPISRAALGKTLGLVKSTVSNLVNDLIEQQWVCELGTGKSSGGRKPVMLTFNNNAGNAIGIDLSINQLHGVLTDMNGVILRRQQINIDTSDPSDVIAPLTTLIRSLISEASNSPYGVVGIGIGSPGLISAQGEILFASSLQWENVPLAAQLEETLGLPVNIYNEARAGAMAEIQRVTNEKISDLVYISIGPTIGTGIVMNGNVYSGAHGRAGEAGHMLTHMGGNSEPRNWQQQASLRSLLHSATSIQIVQQKQQEWELDRPTLSLLMHLAEEGNPDVLALFHETGEAIGLGIVNLMYLLNPPLIVIGGEMAQAERWLSPSMHEIIQERFVPRLQQQAEVRFSPLGRDATLKGAACLTINKIINRTRVMVS